MEARLEVRPTAAAEPVAGPAAAPDARPGKAVDRDLQGHGSPHEAAPSALAYLPRGQLLPDDVWQRRHRFVMALVVAHVPAILAYAFFIGFEPWHAILEAGIPALLVTGAALPFRSRVVRSSLASAALVSCSAILAHLSGGLIEMHFHFFVSLAVITFYQEWVPFVLSISYVVLHHGIIGAIDPTAVYNHPAAIANPWRWAFVHGFFVASACVVYAIQWRFNEDLRDHAELLLDSAGEGVLGVDRRGAVAFANPAAGRLLGMPSERLVGWPVQDVLPGLTLPPARPTGPIQRHVQEVDAVASRGRHLPVECIVTPVRRHGSLRHVIGFNDITQRRLVQQVQREQVENLRKLDRMKSEFLSTAAHELRTPLMPLGLQVEILQTRGAGRMDAGDARALEILARNVGRLRHLVDDMLSMARLEAGRMELQPADVDLVALLGESADAFQGLAERGGVRLRTSCPDGLRIRADPLRLSQVLFNLLSNALRHTPAGGEVHVEALPAGAGGEVEVRVHDTGAGLSAEQMERLFTPFGQVHDEAPVQRLGTGLGLFICQALVRLHGGRIWAESAGPGRGTTFRFTLPVAGPPAGSVGPAPREGLPSTGAWEPGPAVPAMPGTPAGRPLPAVVHVNPVPAPLPAAGPAPTANTPGPVLAAALGPAAPMAAAPDSRLPPSPAAPAALRLPGAQDTP